MSVHDLDNALTTHRLLFMRVRFVLVLDSLCPTTTLVVAGKGRDKTKG